MGTDQIMNVTDEEEGEEDSIEEEDEEFAPDVKEDDELDDILNDEEQQQDNLDDIFDSAKHTEQAYANDERDENKNSTQQTVVPIDDDDDDFSYGDDSLDEDELTHKVDEADNKPDDQPDQQEELLQQEEIEQQERELSNEPSQDELIENEGEEMLIDPPRQQDMKKSDTLDSLDFLLDASSTIAEEPEEDQEYDEDDNVEDAGIPNEDHQMMENPYDDGSLIESIIEEEEEDEVEEEMEEPDMEEEDAEDALPPLRCKLLLSDQYHPEYGLEELYPEDLDLVDSLTAFEEGAISNEEMAVLIIEALFERDFENGDHWEIDQGTARDLEEDEGGGGDLEGCAFVVKRQARLDWNDLYSVAAAKGTIIISAEEDEIKVENYSYFVAG